MQQEKKRESIAALSRTTRKAKTRALPGLRGKIVIAVIIVALFSWPGWDDRRQCPGDGGKLGWTGAEGSGPRWGVCLIALRLGAGPSAVELDSARRNWKRSYEQGKFVADAAGNHRAGEQLD